MDDVTFRNCAFKDCRFINCDLSLIKLPQTHFRETAFKHCRMIGINWSQADWETHSLLAKKRIDFEECLLDHSLFIEMDLSETKFINCKARQMDFEGSNLSQGDFSGTDFQGTRFIKCDLSQANFTGAVNYAIDASQNKFHKTRFSLPEAISLLHSLDIILEEGD
jgi:uncharacterized protein YjbI with pentapeptide repeats